MNNDLFDNMKKQMKPNENLVQSTKVNITKIRKQKYQIYSFRQIAIVACFILIFISIYAISILKKDSLPVINITSDQSNTNDNQTNIMNSTIDNSSSETDLSSTGSVLYMSLRFPDSSGKKQLNNNQQSTTGVISFDESCLKDAVMLIKCTIMNAYIKDYNYDVYNDKFEKNGTLKYGVQSIIYELKIDDVLYSECDFKTGDIIKVECISWSELVVNRQYILPINYSGLTIINPEESYYAGGDITRDSPYGIICSYEPQIEVTLDQQYVFTDRWVSLLNNNTVDVLTEENDSSNNAMENVSYHKFKLRNDDQFLNDLIILIKGYKE